MIYIVLRHFKCKYLYYFMPTLNLIWISLVIEYEKKNIENCFDMYYVHILCRVSHCFNFSNNIFHLNIVNLILKNHY